MLGLYVRVPVACFRRGLAREYLETEPLPPPATCYGLLLSLVGEEDRLRHVGSRICPVLLGRPDRSTVLRTVWRIKSAKSPPGSPGNTRPDYQQLLTNVELALWLDSSDENAASPTLEQRVAMALARPAEIARFGGLSLGESTHLVDEVRPLRREDVDGKHGQAYLLAELGRLTMPVWVDHVGSSATRWVTGNLVETWDFLPPERSLMPQIAPKPAAA